MASAADGGFVAPGEILVGDSAQRVTVPLPRSLHELRAAANRHFHNGRGMYQHGRIPLSHPNHITGVHNNDVIVIATGAEQSREAPPITTHAAHYVKHDIEIAPPRPPPQQLDRSARFDGIPTYVADYVKHPLEARKPARPPASHWDAGKRAGGPVGKSTYAAHYPWHDPQLPAPMSKARELPPAAPFEGVTSYNTDYIKHPARPRTSMAPSRERVRESPPFEGGTTYTEAYQKYETPRMPKHPGYNATLKPEPAPFEGLSEYTREYLKHPFEDRPIVHLEPELRRIPSDYARPNSAPAGSRRVRAA